MKKYLTIISLLFFNLANGQIEGEFSSSVRQNYTWVQEKYQGPFQQIIDKYASPLTWNTPEFVNTIHIDRPFIDKIDIKDLKNKRIPNQIIHSLYFIDNKFTFNKIKEIAQNNMTDAEAKMFGATSLGKEGSADRRYYQKILSYNWIAAYGIYDIHTMDEEYDRIDAANKKRAIEEARNPKIKNKYKFTPVNRTDIGYVGNIYIKFYKIDLEDEERFYSFEKNIFKNGTEDSEGISERIMNYDFPIKEKYTVNEEFKSVKNKKYAESEGITMNDLLNRLISNDKINGFVSNKLKTTNEFKNRTSVFSTKPTIQAKIGKKEGIYTNERFLIYEVVLNKKGKKKKRRKGAVRVKGEPIDNRGIASGNATPSNFYQYFGRKLDKGMLLEESPAKNFIQISLLKGLTVTYGNYSKKITGFKSLIGLEFFSDIYDKKQYLTGQDTISTINFFIGMNKEFNFLNNFSFDISGGLKYGSTNYKEENNDDNVSTEEDDISNTAYGLFLEPNLGMYISPSLKLGVSYRKNIDVIHGKNSEFSDYKQPGHLRISLQYYFNYSNL